MQIAQGAVISVITSKLAQQIMQLLEMNETNPTLTPEEVDRLRKALVQYEQQQSQK
jgi:predicted Zn-dependent peptidase